MSTATLTEPNSTESAGASASGGALSQIVSFRIGREAYGVDVMHVQEIILFGHVTEMPNVAEYVRGLINLRGHVIPIVDLRRRFGLAESDHNEQSRIVVLNVGEKTIGVIVDAVEEVLRVSNEQIEPAAGMTGIGHDYVRGLIKFETKLLILLNVENILEDDEMTGDGGA